MLRNGTTKSAIAPREYRHAPRREIRQRAFARELSRQLSRLWNRTLTITPKIPKRYRGEWPENAQDKLYIVCCITHHMLSVLADDTSWAGRLKEIIGQRPGVPLKAMG